MRVCGQYYHTLQYKSNFQVTILLGISYYLIVFMTRIVRNPFVIGVARKDGYYIGSIDYYSMRKEPLVSGSGLHQLKIQIIKILQ